MSLADAVVRAFSWHGYGGGPRGEHGAEPAHSPPRFLHDRMHQSRLKALRHAQKQALDAPTTMKARAGGVSRYTRHGRIDVDAQQARSDAVKGMVSGWMKRNGIAYDGNAI